jgi:hypothetical protein
VDRGAGGVTSGSDEAAALEPVEFDSGRGRRQAMNRADDRLTDCVLSRDAMGSPPRHRSISRRVQRAGCAMGHWSPLHVLRGMVIQGGNTGDWNHRGDRIVFSRHANGSVLELIWIINADGSGFRDPAGLAS